MEPPLCWDDSIIREQNSPFARSSGQEVEVFTDEKGGVWSVVETSGSDLLTRAATSSSTTFNFKYTNWLGQKKDAFKVKLTCQWNKNGSNSKITNLIGAYTVLDSSFTCSWDSDSGSYVSDVYHQLYLDVWGDGGSAWYIFDALCNRLDSDPYIDFDYSAN